MKTTAFALLAALICAPFAWAGEQAAASARPPEVRVALEVTITTAISVELLKRTFKDPRPEASISDRPGSNYGFPSGDAALAFGLATVASEYHPEHKWLWYLIAARVAWSRVKKNAHDWDDVIGGAALGSWIGERAVADGGIILKQWRW